jgi:hypothetical protein
MVLRNSGRVGSCRFIRSPGHENMTGTFFYADNTDLHADSFFRRGIIFYKNLWFRNNSDVFYSDT